MPRAIDRMRVRSAVRQAEAGAMPGEEPDLEILGAVAQELADTIEILGEQTKPRPVPVKARKGFLHSLWARVGKFFSGR